MPLIRLSQEVIDRSKLPEVGWSPATLIEVTENPAANKESVNFFFNFKCSGGPENKSDNNGRHAVKFFNSKALGMVNPSSQRPEVVQEFLSMVAALNGIKKSEVEGDDYEGDKLVGKSCWIKIIATTDQNGKLQIAISDFSADQDVPF